MSILALAAISVGSAPTSASAAGRFVSATSGSDGGNNCLDQYARCATIQHAIDESNPGDTVDVAAGTYAEQLVIGIPITLEGPNSGLDPLIYSRNPEAVIDGGTGTAITPEASNIAIEGFTISTDGAGTPIRTAGTDVDRLTVHTNIIESDVAGVRLEAGGEDTSVSYNVIEGGEYGVRLDGTDYTDLEIRYNRLTGPVDSDGVFAGGGTAINGFLLEGNEFATASIAASISNGRVLANDIEPPAGGVGLRVDLHESILRENSIRGNGGASCLQLLGSSGGLDPSTHTTISGNEFAGCVPYALQLGPEVEAINITGNTFPNSYDGIVTDNNSPWDVTGSGIKVFGNRIVGTIHLGVDNPVGGTLDARNNWWGCNAGPGAFGCDSVSSGVDSSPNVVLTAEASEDAEKAWTAPVSALNPGEKAVIIAYLKNGDGGEALNVPTAGTTVSFSSPRGALSPTSATWLNARGISVFTAGPQPGPAGIVVTMDNQQVGVPLTITGPSPPVSSPSSPSPPFVDRPQIRIPRGTLSLSRRNAVIGTISCAQIACRVGRGSAVAKVGRKRFRVKLRVPTSIAAEGIDRIRVVMPERAFRQLSRHGTGALKIAIKVTDASNSTASTTRRVKIKWEGPATLKSKVPHRINTLFSSS